MQSGFMNTICQMCIFMICAQVIVHFRPKASYEKYLKMLVSSMILIQLFASVSGIFGSAGEAKLLERAEQFAESMEESMREASEIAFFEEEDLPLQIVGEDPEEAAKEGGTDKGIQDISVQINPVSPVQINVNSGNAE